MARLRARKGADLEADAERRRRIDTARGRYYADLAAGMARGEAIKAANESYRVDGNKTAEAAKPAAPAVSDAATKAVGIEAPDDWREMHWKKRVALAVEMYPGAKFVNGGDADEAIRRYLEDSR